MLNETFDLNQTLGVVHNPAQFPQTLLTPVETNPMNQAQRVSFMEVLSNVIQDVDTQGKAASAKMTAVDTGVSDDLVGAMIASQKASLSFSAMVQVRNNLLSAYDDIMKMPV
ncbi:flagellar hook-basal body complex protein FliE [Vibrio harveyi]|nr:flagellar hook-basal body complex protein FliE [Vibrio harveyi]